MSLVPPAAKAAKAITPPTQVNGGVGAPKGGLSGAGTGVLISATSGAGLGSSGSVYTGEKQIVLPAKSALSFKNSPNPSPSGCSNLLSESPTPTKSRSTGDTSTANFQPPDIYCT